MGKNYSAAEKYYAEHGNLLVNVNDNGHGGVKLGRWIRHQREKYETLSLSRREKLDAIGLIAEKTNPWEKILFA